MKQLVICCLLVLILSVYTVVGAKTGHAARSAQRARRDFVDDRTLDRSGIQFHRLQKKSHLLNPHKRFRREAENPDFYKRGDTGVAEERLKRVKKYSEDVVM